MNPNSLIRIQIKKWIKDAFEGGSNDIQSIYTLNGKYSEESLDDVMLKFTDGFIDKIRSSKENSKTRDTMINDLTNIFNTLENDDGELIQIEGDPIIQIGSVFYIGMERQLVMIDL